MSKNNLPNRYRELVLPGLSYFFVSLPIAVGAAMIVLPFGQVGSAIAGFGTLFTWIGIGFLVAKVIVIDDQSLQVGKAKIARSHLGLAEAIRKENAVKERGPKLHSMAYVLFQFGVSTLVKVEIKDANDPAPYWLFSSRQPDVVAELLNKR